MSRAKFDTVAKLKREPMSKKQAMKRWSVRADELRLSRSRRVTAYRPFYFVNDKTFTVHCAPIFVMPEQNHVVGVFIGGKFYEEQSAAPEAKPPDYLFPGI